MVLHLLEISKKSFKTSLNTNNVWRRKDCCRKECSLSRCEIKKDKNTGIQSTAKGLGHFFANLTTIIWYQMGDLSSSRGSLCVSITQQDVSVLYLQLGLIILPLLPHRCAFLSNDRMCVVWVCLLQKSRVPNHYVSWHLKRQQKNVSFRNSSNQELWFCWWVCICMVPNTGPSKLPSHSCVA